MTFSFTVIRYFCNHRNFYLPLQFERQALRTEILQSLLNNDKIIFYTTIHALIR